MNRTFYDWCRLNPRFFTPINIQKFAQSGYSESYLMTEDVFKEIVGGVV